MPGSPVGGLGLPMNWTGLAIRKSWRAKSLASRIGREGGRLRSPMSLICGQSVCVAIGKSTGE